MTSQYALDTPYAPARAGTRDTPFANVATLLVDSVEGVALAREQGLEDTARIVTSAPALLCDASLGAVDLGSIMNGERLHRLAQLLDTCSQSAYAAIRKRIDDEHWAMVAAGSITRLQVPLAKRLALEALRPEMPIGVVASSCGDKRADRELNPDWTHILAGSGLRSAVSVQHPARVAEGSQDGHTVAPLWTRMSYESAASMGYRVVSQLHARLRQLPSRGELLIWRENSLLKEAAFSLSLRGYRLRRLQLAPSTTTAATPVACPPAVERAVDEAMAALREEWGRELPATTLTELAQVVLHDQARQFLAARDSLLRSERGRARVVALLTNAKSSAAGLGVHAACRELGVPVFGFQHAPTVEFHAGHRRITCLFDNQACDEVFVYAPQTKRALDASAYAAAESHVVGAPTELSNVGKRLRVARKLPPVFYVSTALYSGNVQLAAMKGVPDGDKAKRELAIVRQVLARLPHEVLYKPYPATRYIDPDPVLEAASQAPNIVVFDQQIDLRYLAGHARFIITSRATSTLAWCLASGVPVVFLDHPHDLPLTDDAAHDLGKGVFLVRWADGRGLDEMRTLLSHPLDELEGDYRAREPHRRAFVDQYLGIGAGNAGGAAARMIATKLASRRRQ